MSSAEVAAKAVKDLDREELKVLRALAASLRDHESLTIDQIARRARIHMDRARFHTSRLNQRELVFGSRRGYSLVSAGLDVLALRTFADKDVIVGMGGSIGVGKESDVFEAVTPDQRRIAIKFFRIGRTSFRDVARKRVFGKKLHHWLLVNMDAAKHEFSALRTLHRAGVKVPEPIAIAKHTIVMELVEGPRLVHCQDLGDPGGALEALLKNIKLAYRTGVISADLSEYNVLFDGSELWIIDWPQSVSRTHPNAQLLLKRDLRNLIKFFERKYGLKYQLADAINYVVSNR